MIVTVGHSNREEASFGSLLKENGVGVLVDIRSHPGSTHCPWFNQEAMKVWVPGDFQVPYFWWPQLGGWAERFGFAEEDKRAFNQLGLDYDTYNRGIFPKHRIGKVRTETQALASGDEIPFWNNWGLFDYSLFMTTKVFLDAADRLAAFAKSNTRVAIMCAEELWWKCHRSLVADYLTFRGVEVYHLQPKWTLHKTAIGDRLERYHPYVQQCWQARQGAQDGTIG